MLTTWTLPQMTYADEMWIRRVLDEDAKRLAQIGAAWDAYNGVNQETLKPSQAEKTTRSADNVVVNFVQLVVDTSVFFLFGEDLQFDLDINTGPSERTPDEAWLDGMWAHNRKMVLLQKLATNGGVTGHAFVKIKPAAAGQQYPRLINLSPEYVHVLTDPDDIDEVRRYIIQYPAVDPVNGDRLVMRQVVERNDGGRWQVRDQESRNDGQFVTVQEGLWPWEWCPIVDCQNLPVANEYYGRSDIEEHVVSLQKSINFVLSNLQRIIKFHGHPKTWGQGFRREDLKIGVDETIVLPTNATLQNLEMLSDLSSSIELYGRLKESLHQITQTPEVAAGKLESVGNLSGVALRILYGPLLAKTSVKRTLYGPLIQEIHRRTLDMAGRRSDQETQIHWPESLPTDALAERQTALIDRQLGVSNDTLLQQLGYDPEAEREKRQQNVTDMADTMLGAFDRGETDEDEEGRE
jgi:hypothetical protein